MRGGEIIELVSNTQGGTFQMGPRNELELLITRNTKNKKFNRSLIYKVDHVQSYKFLSWELLDKEPNHFVNV